MDGSGSRFAGGQGMQRGGAGQVNQQDELEMNLRHQATQQREFNGFVVDLSQRCFTDCIKSFTETKFSDKEASCLKNCIN